MVANHGNAKHANLRRLHLLRGTSIILVCPKQASSGEFLAELRAVPSEQPHRQRTEGSGQEVASTLVLDNSQSTNEPPRHDLVPQADSMGDRERGVGAALASGMSVTVPSRHHGLLDATGCVDLLQVPRLVLECILP